MPWGVATAAIGAGASFYGSSQASKAQQQGTNSAIGEQQREYDSTRNDNQTSLDARNYGLAQMQNLAGNYKPLTAADVMAQPGYQFGLTQGQNGLNQNAAATGGLYSGAQLRAASAFNNNYATTKYQQAFDNARTDRNDQFDQYRSLATGGQTGANAISTAGMNMANNVSGLLSANGNAQGASSIANANAIGNFANQAGSALKTWYDKPSNPSYSGLSTADYPTSGFATGSNPNYGNEGRNSSAGYADGGPVRDEPVIGSRSPLPSGGGGGLSSQAILNAILARGAKRGELPGGIGTLPANPVTHPGAILRSQEEVAMHAHGGPVHGPGDGSGRDDAVPARLTRDEFVFSVPAVQAIGDGNVDRGLTRLSSLHDTLRDSRPNALGSAKLNLLRSVLGGRA